MTISIPPLEPSFGNGLRLGKTQRIIPGRCWLGPSVDGGTALRWKYGPGTKEADSDARVLEDFLAIAAAKPERAAARVLNFAERHGPLRLCSHGMPHEHSWAPLHPLSTDKCPPTKCEPVETWRQYAQGARSLLAVARGLHAGKAASEADWETVYGWARMADSAGRTEEGMPRVIAIVAQYWARLGNLRPQLVWSPKKGRHEFVMAGVGTFGAIAHQLLRQITRGGQLVACHGCGTSWVPKTHPRAGELSWCEECKEDGTRANFYNRKSRAAKRRGASTETV